MRYHGHARVNQRAPQAWAVCDRCGFIYNHVDLNWQFDWQGPRQQNLRILVCQSCLDKPFEHNRTLILPPDPVAIANARPEPYALDNNPISPASFDPLIALLPQADPANIGNMTQGGGLDAPYAQVGLIAPPGPNAPVAYLDPSWSFNWLGKFWSYTTMPPILPGFTTNGNNSLQYGIGSFQLQAPAEQAFLASGLSTAIAFWGWDGVNWNPIWTGQSAGVPGETLTVTLPSTTPYYSHAVTIAGDGSRSAVAGFRMNAVGDGILSPTVGMPLTPPLPTAPIFVFMTATSLLDSAPTLDTPAAIVTGGFLLTPTSLQVGSPAFGAPLLSVGVVTGLLATSFLDSAPILGTPALSQGHVLVATPLAAGSPILGAPMVGVGLVATPLAGAAPTLGTPALTQVHVLTATPLLDSAPQIGVPALFPQAIGFTVTTAPVTPLLGTPLLSLIGGSAITLNPAMPLMTQAAVTDTVPQFSIPFVATALATSKPIVDTIPAFLKH
jgi:hypothetical protein